jgi:hypothetical protein
MTLDKVLANFRIDFDALASIKKRVYIVGRFTQLNLGPQPDVFLFTNRRDTTPRYRKNFTACYDMRYESFVQALRPAIAELVTQEGRFPSVEQVVPQAGASEGTSVIDVFNYFFTRAAANSEQPAFRDAQAGLAKELLKTSDDERGKAILTQIRNNLATFCAFQPRTHEIIGAVAGLLGECGMEKGMPAFAAGGALPGGFAEKLIDFLYAEDARKRFTVEGLDLTRAPWDKLAKDENAREIFCSVVSAFRDALLANPADQYSDLRFAGKPLMTLARERTKESLQRDFGNAREAFNGLRQILRSKVLLSMVLEWLLASYDTIPDLKALPQGSEQATKDIAVTEAILRRWKENGLARPVKRPSPNERHRFSKSLTENFEHLLNAVLAEDAKLAEQLEKLPPELQALANEIRADDNRRRLLAAISGAKLGDEFSKAFIDASKTVLLDVLCPVLYRNPILTSQMLKKYFRQETMAAYLTAVFLGDSQQDAVKKIAEDHLEYFESKIDDATKKIKDSNEIMSRLLSSFVDVLAQPEIQKRLTDGIKVLHEVHAILDDADAREERGAGSISAILPSDIIATQPTAGQRSVEKTPTSQEVIMVSIPRKLERALDARIEAASGTASDTGASAAPAGDTQPAGSAPASSAPPTPSADAQAAAAAEEGAPEQTKTTLDRKIDEILDKVVGTVPETITAEQKEAWLNQAKRQILDDKTFVGGLAENLRAFERTLHLIYTRYNGNPDKKTFRNKVERLTLVNIMLLSQKDLGLGKVYSSLYQLLLDLVLRLDPANPDPKDFLREHSLTQYFDDAKLDDPDGLGITELRQTLRVQGRKSLENVVKFVSELRGMKYLMDAVQSDPQAEVVVVNSTATEFMTWLRGDNLTEDEGQGRMRAGRLVQTEQAAQGTIPPGLVYLTDIAFPDVTQRGWIQSLSGFTLNQGRQGLVLPPFCISVAPGEGWARTGQDLAVAAASASAPIVVAGPSPYLNPRGDGFPTVLPAGYLLCAHLLGASEQRVKNSNVAQPSVGRFRVVGRGEAPMPESLNRILWGEDEKDVYSFAVDFYLYVALMLEATAAHYEGMDSLNTDAFYKCFYFTDKIVDKDDYRSSSALDRVLIGGKALRFAMQDEVGHADLTGVSLLRDGTSFLSGGGRQATITNVAWFNDARRRLGLLSEQSQPEKSSGAAR